jgi:hypothetical protein
VLAARRTSAVAALALVTAMLCAVAPIPTFAADPPPIVVSPGDGDSSGVGIGVHDPGARGDHGSQGKPSGSNACDFPEGAPVPPGCEAVEQARYCAGLARAAAQVGGYNLANMTPGQLAALNTTLVGVGCPQWNGGAPPTAVELAQSAYGLLSLPAPVPSRYPTGSLRDGRPYTIVQTHMWFWSDPSVWKPLSKTVCAGALCATATASPSSLSFDPGNGDQPVSCAGPGRGWVRPAGGSWVPTPQPQGCDYQYATSTYGYPNGELTATYTITWGVRWTGTNGNSGTLNPLATTVTSTFAVAELQSVVSQ